MNVNTDGFSLRDKLLLFFFRAGRMTKLKKIYSKNYYMDLLYNAGFRPRGNKVKLAWSFMLVILVWLYFKKKYLYNVFKSKVPVLSKGGNESNVPTKRSKSKIGDYYRLLSLCQKKDKTTFLTLGMYGGVLVTRIVLTIKLMDNIASTIRHLSARKWHKIFDRQYTFNLMCVLSACFSAAQRYLESYTEAKISKNLSLVLHDKYYKDNLFYSCENDSVDQIITNGVESFSRHFIETFNGIVKPSVDVAYLSFLLARKTGIKNLIGFYSYFSISGFILHTIKPNFTKLIKEGTILKDRYSINQSRVKNFKEEIGFLGGGNEEKIRANNKLIESYKYSKSLMAYKIIYDFYETYLIKYGGMMCSFMITVPTIYSGKITDAGDIIEYSVKTTNYLISLSSAIKDLISVQKSIYSLNSSSQRITNLLGHLNHHHTLVIDNSNYEIDDHNQNITVNGMNLKTPDGSLDLIKNLNVSFLVGENTIISGVNGAGKSSFLRALAGLWKCEGDIKLPKRIVYVPQRPYFVVDTLYKAIAYPKCLPSFEERKVIDELLEEVGLESIKDRYANDEIVDWYTVLSGGENQRLSIVRALYMKPDYCVLDEATSQMSVDIESSVYELCNRYSKTIISIAHKESLYKYHKKRLHLLGEGKYEISEIKE